MKNISWQKQSLFLVLTIFLMIVSSIQFPMFENAASQELNQIQHSRIEIPCSQDEDSPYVEEKLSNLSIYFQILESESKITGHLNLSYFNADPIAFSQIPFHLYLSGMEYISRKGKMEILGVRLLESPLTSLPYQVHEDQQLMWVNLSSDLQPNERIKIQINFTCTLPDGGIDRANEHGKDADSSRIFKASHCYPIPCVYDQWDGWNTDPYLPTGDPFYSDMAFYDIFVEAPAGMIIASTGELFSKKSVNGSILHHYNSAFPVREITFAASRYFQTETENVNGVNLTTYFLPKSTILWKTNALRFAKQALTLFNASFGTYPYPTLNIVQEYTNYGGMEYPCQVYISQAYDDMENAIYRIEKTIVHETGHQWFYQLIGVDEVDWGFLDEGLVCWATDFHYIDKYYPESYSFSGIEILNRVRNYAINTEFKPNTINLSVYECEEQNVDYWYVAYGKAPVIFEKLSLTLGPAIFLQGIQLFFTQFQFQIAMLSDLQAAMEQVSGENLDWFFLPWFDNPQIPKYAATDVRYDKNTQSVSFTIIDSNENYNPYKFSQQLPIKILKRDNIIYEGLKWINGTTTLNISVEEAPSKLKIVFSQDILHQFDLEEENWQEYTIKGGSIPGFDSVLLIGCSILAIGFHIFNTRKRAQ
ncbi:hypothetical protein NEF87_002242 [Candidatus Lokiarchaeum ossiferum]|uniref:Peptidase M1 membrane alanine aminopeptidase domain-containing protein n=1 Tax=Candidatus Lokiarchaeum ossiferum TaxID=2951803 RepID=A0ABY6HSW0_9ARCH|nr:hypothetical protein NEF87_002242 [Candidatus Lokiarchaeum sp. B-35]